MKPFDFSIATVCRSWPAVSNYQPSMRSKGVYYALKHPIGVLELMIGVGYQDGINGLTCQLRIIGIAAENVDVAFIPQPRSNPKEYQWFPQDVDS